MTTIKNYKICTGTTIEGLEGEVKETMNSQEIGGMGWKWVPCGGITLSEKGVMFQAMILEG